MLVASLDIGGAETHIATLSSALAARGHKVTVASRGGQLCERLCGVEHIKIDLSSRSIVKLLRSYILLLRAVRKLRPDVIHSHSRIASFIGEMVARRERICFVTTVHARCSTDGPSGRLSRWGYYSIAVSDDLSRYLSANYSVCADKITVIPNGVDTGRFLPSECKKNRIVFVSRLDSDCSDAAYALCRISRRLIERYRGIEIRIVGGGSEYQKIAVLAKNINLSAGYEALTLSGAKNDVAAELSSARLFVGVGRCAIEAMSAAAPTIIAGNEGYFGIVNEKNAAEAASENFCARGCKGINDERLFDDICALLDMEDGKRKALSRYLREYAIEHNSVNSVAEKTLEAYEKVRSSVSFSPFGVCLCGYYGYENTGDDTLLDRAILRARQSFGNLPICALAHSKNRARYRFGIPCFNRYNILSVIRVIGRSRVLVFGGGTLFQDSTSLRSMLYYSSVACLALLFGKRVELWGNGFSKPKYATSRLLLRFILSRAAYVGTRDKPSLFIAREYGAKGARLEGDLAMGIKKSDCHATPNTDYITKNLDRFALFSLSKRTSRAEYEIFLKRAREIDVSPLVVSMYKGEDREINKRFAKEVGARYVEGLSASELIYLAGRADLCISARLHLLVFAKIANTPFERVGNDVKLVAFCDENG